MIITDIEKLSEICDYVDTKKDGKIMRETILELKQHIADNNLLALSAPQIGVDRRIFCVKDKKGIHSFINPMIRKSTDMTFSKETDPCFPDKTYIHPRSAKVVVNYQTPLGEMRTTTVVGYSAFMFQQMIDHLNGLCLPDIGLEIDEEWDKATDDERAEVLKAYMESLDMVSKKLNEEIENNPDLAKQKKAIDFEQALIAGEVQVEEQELTEEQKEAITAKLENTPKE